ncbi:hypothetical protein J6590_015862 [Homalodisca vitripennis]|nr:hypothetical protein J6590_015862 [Homalodisca vitripennis]
MGASECVDKPRLAAVQTTATNTPINIETRSAVRRSGCGFRDRDRDQNSNITALALKNKSLCDW